MSADRLSAATKTLLKAAKADAPSAAARAKVWGGVSSAIGGAAAGVAGAGVSASTLTASGGAGGASAGMAGAAFSGMSAMKMLVLGTLLGGTVTVGLAAMLLRVGPSPTDVPPATTVHVLAAASPLPAPLLDPQAVAGARATTAQTDVAAPTAMVQDPTGSQVSATAAAAGGPTAASAPRSATWVASPPRGHGAQAPGHATLPTDSLAREASLVADARAALARGDAQAALRAVESARAVPSPQLVPEEMAVEAQALRLLGSSDEAKGIDATLRARYPESALAR
jgi:hypothetical protein